MSITPTNSSALIIIDVQNDFLPGGALAVNDGDAVIDIINSISPSFPNLVVTQDWHPKGHISFASTHDAEAFSVREVEYGPQVMWPDHCVQATHGGALADNLQTDRAQLIIRKGCNIGLDSYSAFIEADKATSTGLAGYLRMRKISEVFLVGLATDFCVAFSAIDACTAGFDTYVIEDACRAIDLDGSLAAAWKDMTDAGVKRIASDHIDVA